MEPDTETAEAKLQRENACRDWVSAMAFGTVMLISVGLGSVVACVGLWRTPVRVGPYVVAGPRWADDQARVTGNGTVMKSTLEVLETPLGGKETRVRVQLVWRNGGFSIYRQ